MAEVSCIRLRGCNGATWSLPVRMKGRQYGGRGTARPSLWIPLPGVAYKASKDKIIRIQPSIASGRHNEINQTEWLSLFRQAFEEHVDGFHGRAFSASVRRQRQSTMDWKLLQHAKATGVISSSTNQTNNNSSPETSQIEELGPTKNKMFNLLSQSLHATSQRVSYKTFKAELYLSPDFIQIS